MLIVANCIVMASKVSRRTSRPGLPRRPAPLSALLAPIRVVIDVWRVVAQDPLSLEDPEWVFTAE